VIAPFNNVFVRPSTLLSFLDRLLSKTSRNNTTVLLLLVSCAVMFVGAFVIRDMQLADDEAQNMYTRSVSGLQRIGDLQYDAQETRRATLYALTTSDSNLQIEYADQSRDADRRVKEGIVEYTRQAVQPTEIALANRLMRDWTNYLSVRDEVLALILEGSTRDAVQLDLTSGVPAFDLVRHDLNDVKLLYDDDEARRLATVVAMFRRSSLRVVGVLVFTIAMSSAAVWAIQRGRMLNTIQLAKLQMEFVASVSHELRTPLAVLGSAADNIADGLVEGKAGLRKYGAVLQNQTRRMSLLVDEILLFASTEDRKNHYVLQPLEVSRIVDTVAASMEGMIQREGFILVQSLEPNLPLVLGDFTGICQCLQNLIGNAIKYSRDDRTITLRGFVAQVGNGPGSEVQISATDRGLGIDRSDIAHIFDPFYRSPRVVAAQIHGTGLGLSLAKRIVEAMGGKISVTSELSAGSTFTLHLQIAMGERASSVSTDSSITPQAKS
jgi:signal transduction histidine kinase